jgi:peroxiredoxin
MVAIVLGGMASAAHAGKFNPAVDIGDSPPAWHNLPGTDGRTHSLADYADKKFVVLVFTCNHCPCALANEDRIKALQDDYAARGVQVVAINIGLDDDDSLQAMQQRARQRQFNFPYLRDESQQTGRHFGAMVTPHVFVLDAQRRIVYMGAIDDSPREPALVKKHYLREALDALLAGGRPRVAETRMFGCAIQYRASSGAADPAEPQR